jgi:three-Cys-motif partner protein
MPNSRDVDLSTYDSIGPWSEKKHDIISKYAAAFATITTAHGFRLVYIDGFAGAGRAQARETGQIVHGSPLRAIDVKPPFDELHFVELDRRKATLLRQLAHDDPRVTVHVGDCNVVLPRDVLPRVRYSAYARALCVLDPYGLHLDWCVVMAAAQTGATDVLVNLPVMDINMNVLRRSAAEPDRAQAARMTAFWGDESWREALRPLSDQYTLFGDVEHGKASNESVAEAYCHRLRDHAGFEHVAEPIEMRNSRNSVVYYLMFGSHKGVAVKVMNDVARKSKQEG